MRIPQAGLNFISDYPDEEESVLDLMETMVDEISKGSSREFELQRFEISIQEMRESND